MILTKCFCCRCILLLVIYILAVVDQLPRLGKREIICLLSLTCYYVVSVRRCFLFLLVLGMGCIILMWHSLSLQCNYFALQKNVSDERVDPGAAFIATERAIAHGHQ